jgi:hypothetical protein
MKATSATIKISFPAPASADLIEVYFFFYGYSRSLVKTMRPSELSFDTVVKFLEAAQNAKVGQWRNVSSLGKPAGGLSARMFTTRPRDVRRAMTRRRRC